METALIILVVLGATIAICWFLVRKKDTGEGPVLQARLDILDKALERNERLLREEMERNRSEMTRQIGLLTQSNEQKIEQLRLSVSGGLQQIQEDNGRKLDQMRQTVDEKLQGTLERRLGAKLFDRHRHGMEVTPAARGVLAQAESMMSNATAIERHLAGLDREMAGIVRIAATEGIAAHWLVPRLGVLRRTHPDIIVQVIAGDQVLDLATRQADLAIRFFRPTSNQLP